jgi:drug/metabolite transporter (DMT)-like permease
VSAASSTIGELYSLTCALIWAVAVILFRKSGETIPPVALNLFKNTVALALFLITLPVLGVTVFPHDVRAIEWAALVVSGVLGIGVADSLFFAALNRIGAGNIAIVDSLYSPFVILIAWAGLREHIGPLVLVAMALMTSAILIGTWEPSAPRTSADRRRTVVGVLMGVLSVLLMAGGLVIMKPILGHADAWWVTTVRLIAGTGFIALQGLLPAHRRAVQDCFRPGRHWRVAIPAAVIGTYLAMITWILGLKYTFASKASVLNQTSSIFVIVLAALFLRERLTVRRGFAVALAIGGAVLATR